MPDEIARSMLGEILAALDLPAEAADRVTFGGSERFPSCFPVSDLAAASIAAAAAAISELASSAVNAPPVAVSYRRASLWFGWSIRPQGWAMANPWDTIAGDYEARDGWIKLHTNAPHHRAVVLSVLGCDPTREAAAMAVAAWSAEALEEAVVSAGGCAARLCHADEWNSHPQGMAVSAEPLMHWDTPALHTSNQWVPVPGRPLAGLRVLDLTRVLAGPVATRFLAGFGADVLRIDPPGWDEPGVIPEVTPGKRCARLDLKISSGRETLIALLREADILVHGYRGDALERLGLGASARRETNPGLIDISLNAYGHTGPWTARRGFDSLVQFSSGIAAAGMHWRGAAAPVSLPVQALDHATGYLLAAAAVRGVISRMTGKGPVRARLSLARTARLLTDHQGHASDASPIELTDADFSPVVEQTDWGPARRLLPPVHVDGAPIYWTRPASRLGSAEPVWAE